MLYLPPPVVSVVNNFDHFTWTEVRGRIMNVKTHVKLRVTQSSSLSLSISLTLNSYHWRGGGRSD